MLKVYFFDYVVGNVCSFVNVIEKCGYVVEWIWLLEDVLKVEVLCVCFVGEEDREY